MKARKTIPMISLILVSNCSDDGLYTQEAYNELRLQMSTGDYHTHIFQRVPVPATTQYTDFGMIDDDGTETFAFFQINETAGA